MTGIVTWLHISDTHFCKEKHGWDSEEIFESFFEDLIRMKNEYNLCPDLIFFTGDVALGHIENSSGLSLKDQYEEAKQFLERILNIFPNLNTSNIFIVPGNHDINRTLVTDDQTDWLENLRKDKLENRKNSINKLITDDGVQWKRYMERLNDYKSFLENNGYKHLLEDPDHLIYSTILNIHGIKVGIAGLNSAWSSYGSDEDKAKLWLGTYQILKAHNKLRDTLLSIVLSHHPSNWFTDFEDLPINRKIESNFNFHLHGHEHQEWVTPINKHIRIASGALYNGFEQKHGYNFVKIDTSESRVEIFLRTYNNGTWIPNIIGNKTNHEGIWKLDNFNINTKKKEYVISDKSDIEAKNLAEKLLPETNDLLNKRVQETKKNNPEGLDRNHPDKKFEVAGQINKTIIDSSTPLNEIKANMKNKDIQETSEKPDIPDTSISSSITGKEQIFRLLPKYGMEYALKAAWDKKVLIFSKSFASLISRPKPEEIKITDQKYLYEPFWHVKCNVHYEYDRTRDYNFSILDPEVQRVTIDGKDYSVATSSRQFTITGIEHCITEGGKEVIFNAVSGQEEQNWKKYLLLDKESVSDVPELSTDGRTFVSPEIRPRTVVQQVFSSLPQPIHPDTTTAEKKYVAIVDLYFRPIYVFEYKWERNCKTAVAEFDGLTGEMNFVGGITLRQKIEKVMTRDLFFDISTEAANLVIPGSGIAVRVIKEVAKNNK